MSERLRIIGGKPPLYSKKWSGPFSMERKPKQIAIVLVKICQENDDRVGQAIYNALRSKYGINKHPDLFEIEDRALLKILKAHYEWSKSENTRLRLSTKKYQG